MKDRSLVRSVMIYGLLVSALVALAATESSACSCTGVSECESYGASDVAFTGEIVEVLEVEGENDMNQFLHRIRVKEPFKGAAQGSLIDVYTDASTSCMFKMEVGSEYLVFGKYWGSQGKLETGLCSGTGPVVREKASLDYLGELRNKGLLDTNEIKGSVFEGREASARVIDRLEFAPAEGGEGVVVGLDSEGKFSLKGIPSGRYKVKALPSDYVDLRLYTSYGPFESDLSSRLVDVSSHGCTVVEIALRSKGTIRGRFIDSAGSPMKRFRLIQLIRYIDSDDFSKRIAFSAVTDNEGDFRFEGLPPGRYLVGINISGHFNQYMDDFEYPVFYHPGGNNIRTATILDLGEGGEIDGIVIQAPRRLFRKTLTGRVQGEDGKPRPGASVRVLMKRGGQSDWLDAIRADEDGNFKLAVFEETVYLIAASNEKKSGKDRNQSMESSSCFESGLDYGGDTIEIVVKDGALNCSIEEK